MSSLYSRARTHGDPVFWSTLDVRKDFKLQQHEFTEHYRILDPENYRINMGLDETAMRNAFYQIIDGEEQAQNENII
ncbi:hypothetical protein [Aquibacillus rhizosphaerae]|uniref:Uncharacterized protein n=1 Tax=Aquibacillus rhizosphaerae TaxID=3051431 RepID=A0ABT7L3W4_9BACI|nr:hypothetical protein [Aquibacillus sp. LR5S19]MDL4840554.1 hypothetical protein [Aquibacillus sp. LR5S19]